MKTSRYHEAREIFWAGVFVFILYALVSLVCYTIYGMPEEGEHLVLMFFLPADFLFSSSIVSLGYYIAARRAEARAKRILAELGKETSGS